MTAPDMLSRGRESFARQAWSDAFRQLTAADGETPLEPEDLERLATVAYLVRGNECTEVWARAHHGFLSRGDSARAIRCAFWLGMGLMFNGERARGSGWIARARRLLEECGDDCVERGYLLVPVALQFVGESNFVGAFDTFGRAAEIGDRFGDRDLMTLARQGRGRAQIQLGATAEGVALLDEVMIAVAGGEVSPIVVGIAYCSVIDACMEIFDVHRAQEWTTALNHWCESEPELVPYRGQCMVRRAEIMQLHGAWPDALTEAQLAYEWLSSPSPQPSIGAALYQQGEIHRLRGEFAAAEDSYRQASQSGRNPHPGLAQLRLAQGQVELACAAIRRAAAETRNAGTRSRMLAACVEIELAAGDPAAARTAAEALSKIAGDIGAPVLRAMSNQAMGAVLLAEGQPSAALAVLREAWAVWREVQAPYEVARVGLLLGLACRALGDADTGEIELDSARQAFQRLGALPDLARLEEVWPEPSRKATGGLTVREVEVLRLVATGKTNRAIAAALSISEKTVARHLSNIFTKLGLASRAAATAYAYQRDLV